MGIIQNLRNAFTKNKTVSGVELMQQVGNNYLSWNGTIYDSDVVRSCIRPKVKAVGKLVGKHLRETLDAEGNRDIKVNPSNAIRFILEEPNPIMTGQMLQEKLATQLCLNSNAFALIVRDEMGNPMEIYPIIPSTVKAYYSETGRLYLKFNMPNAKVFEFPYDDIIHLREDYNENDIFGAPKGPVLTPLLDVVTITDQGVINAIKNSSIVKWLLKFTNSLRPDDLRDQAKRFASDYLSTSDGVGVAATDAKADATQIKPHDYVPNAAVMSATTKRIFDLFNTNASIVASDYTEEQYNFYFDAEIEPVLMQLGGEYTRKLFTRRERIFGNKIIFEASLWDSASISTKLNLLQMVDRGSLLPDEWRAAFHMGPIPGGDQPIRRLDTAYVDTTENLTEGGSTDED